MCSPARAVYLNAADVATQSMAISEKDAQASRLRHYVRKALGTLT